MLSFLSEQKKKIEELIISIMFATNLICVKILHSFNAGFMQLERFGVLIAVEAKIISKNNINISFTFLTVCYGSMTQNYLTMSMCSLFRNGHQNSFASLSQFRSNILCNLLWIFAINNPQTSHADMVTKINEHLFRPLLFCPFLKSVK